MDEQYIQTFVETAKAAGLGIIVQFPNAELRVPDAKQLEHQHNAVYTLADLGGTVDLRAADGFWAGRRERMGNGPSFSMGG
jgi:hypothetical protein